MRRGVSSPERFVPQVGHATKDVWADAWYGPVTYRRASEMRDTLTRQGIARDCVRVVWRAK